MGLTTITGTVSNLQFSSETSGSINKGSGSIHTKQVVSFRLDKKSVFIKLPDRPDIAEGETVTVAGTDKNGLFKGLAIRNDNTNVVFGYSVMQLYIIGGLFSLLGLMTLIILVGVIILPIGLYVLYEASVHGKAQSMLRT